MKKEILIGVITAVIATCFGFYFYVTLFSDYDFETSLEVFKEHNLYGKVLSLSAIPNLFVFFIFLKKKQDYRARGVLLATVFLAIAILILKFI